MMKALYLFALLGALKRDANAAAPPRLNLLPDLDEARIGDVSATIKDIPRAIAANADITHDVFMMQLDAPVCRNQERGTATNTRVKISGSTARLLANYNCVGLSYIFGEKSINEPGAREPGLSNKPELRNILGGWVENKNFDDSEFVETSLKRFKGMIDMSATNVGAEGGIGKECVGGMWAMYVEKDRTYDGTDDQDLCDGVLAGCKNHAVSSERDRVTDQEYSQTLWTVPADRFKAWLARAADEGRVKITFGSAQGLSSVEVGVGGVGTKHQQMAGKNNMVLASGEWRYKDLQQSRKEFLQLNGQTDNASRRQSKLLEIDLNSGTFMQMVPADGQRANAYRMLETFANQFEALFDGVSVAAINAGAGNFNKPDHPLAEDPQCTSIAGLRKKQQDDKENLRSLCELPDIDDVGLGEYPTSRRLPLYPITENVNDPTMNFLAIPSPPCRGFWPAGKAEACELVRQMEAEPNVARHGGGADGKEELYSSLEQMFEDIAKLE